MTTKRKTPDVAVSAVLRYLHQIFKVPVEHCRDFDSAVEHLIDSEVILPAGFTSDPILLQERYSIRAAIWELHKKAPLAQTILELCDDCVYLLLVDETLPGKDGLLFCACCVTDTETAKEDISYHVQNWNKQATGKNVPKILTGSVAIGDNEVIAIAALQLTSFTN